ncbi:hypothetical protein GCM10027562_10700 [Arthrobacter pigmenti]
MHAGVLAATAKFVAVIDGDGSMDPAELPRLLAMVDNSSTSMAVGRRRPVEHGIWPWHARAGTAALAWWIRRSSGVGIHDLAPMRVCRRADLLGLDIQDRRFGYPLELMIKAAQADWSVLETEIAYGRRTRGTRSKVSGSLVGTSRTIADFCKVLL